MAEYSLPTPGHNSRAVDDVEYEALTNAQGADGLIGHPDDDPLIWLDGTALKVRPSREGLLRGRLWATDSLGKTLTPPSVPNGGTTRVDLVVMRLTRSGPAVTTEIRQGTPGSGPPAAVRDSGTTGVYEIELAEATLAPGASTYSVVTPRAWYVGQDGQIRCTATTRPPHQLGRRITQSDGKVYISSGASWWLTRDDSGASAWVMETGYTAQRNVLRRRTGIAVGQLSFRRSTTMSADTDYKVATLPAGFAPTADLDLIGTVLNLTLTVTGVLTTAGVLTVRPAETVAVGQIVLHPATWTVA